MLDRFYDAMADEITRAGGTVEKFAGDAVMAAFGVPVAQEDHVERALHTAIAMRHRLESSSVTIWSSGSASPAATSSSGARASEARSSRATS